MHQPPHPAAINADPPIPFTDGEIGRVAHEQHMPSVRAIAVDPERGLVLLNLIGADASVSAVIMELLRSKSGGVGFLPTLFGALPAGLPTHLTTQPGTRYTTFRSALVAPNGSLNLKNWCLLLATANLTESRRRAPSIPAPLLPPAPPPPDATAAPALPGGKPAAAPPPHYVIGAASATAPNPNALLGHLRAIGSVRRGAPHARRVVRTWSSRLRRLARPCLSYEVWEKMPGVLQCWRARRYNMSKCSSIRDGANSI